MKEINKKVITEYETCYVCWIYNYTLDVVKEMEQADWVLEGTYSTSLIFRKDK